MKTKYYVRFLNRLSHLDADIELADVLKISTNQGRLSSTGAVHLFDAVNPQQHPRLAARKNSAQSRRLAANHLKATLCASFLKDVYEDLTQYFQDVLEAAARNGLDPNRLIGEHKVSFEANDILIAGGWPKVVEMVAKSVFRKLENERSTKAVIEKMNSKLSLGVQRATIDAALPYLEIRHLLIHADGKADQAFCSAFPVFGATAGHKIRLDYTVLQNARTTINELVEEFDRQLVANSVIAQSELQP